jgi:hypothetical protein
MQNNISTAAALMGSARTKAKTAAARENGAKGGRPSKPRFVGAWDAGRESMVTRKFTDPQKAFDAAFAAKSRYNKRNGMQPPYTVDIAVNELDSEGRFSRKVSL